MTTLTHTSLSVANPWSMVPPLGNLDAYITAANRLPMLTPEQEQEFARKLRDENDLEAAGKLVLSHLRLVISVSRQYLGYGLPHADLIQEGNVGLMKAVKRFDPEQGVRLVSYALHWIKAEIHEYILKNWRMVKVATTKAQRKLFFNLRSMKSQMLSEDAAQHGDDRAPPDLETDTPDRLDRAGDARPLDVVPVPRGGGGIVEQGLVPLDAEVPRRRVAALGVGLAQVEVDARPKAGWGTGGRIGGGGHGGSFGFQLGLVVVTWVLGFPIAIRFLKKPGLRGFGLGMLLASLSPFFIFAYNNLRWR